MGFCFVLFLLLGRFALFCLSEVLTSSGWPGTHRDPPASASKVLRFEVWAPKPGNSTVLTHRPHIVAQAGLDYTAILLPQPL